jgi:hypothetical protein
MTCGGIVCESARRGIDLAIVMNMTQETDTPIKKVLEREDVGALYSNFS